MDILGFVFVVAGLIAADHYGFTTAGLTALRMAYGRSRRLLQRAEFHFTVLAARCVVITLIASAAAQFVLLAAATALLPANVQTDWYGTFIAAGAALIAAEVLYAFYQRSGIPHFLTNEQGQTVHWPEFIQNEQGEFVDEEGHVLHVNENGFGLRYLQNPEGHWLDPDGHVMAVNAADLPVNVPCILGQDGNWRRLDGTPIEVWALNHAPFVAEGAPLNTREVVEETDVRVPHPLAGLPRLNNDHPNRLGRVSAGWSVALILLTFMVIGTGILTVGVHGRSSLVFLLGAMCFYAMLMALQLVASILAWFVLKGTKLLEFIATVVTEEGLVALPGIKWSNIKAYLPEGVNILDEEHAAAVLRVFPRQLAIHITPFVAVVWMWTDPAVAKFVFALLVITSLTGWYLAKNGGTLEVERRRYQFARWMFYILPAICVLGFLAGLVPDVKNAIEGRSASLQSGLAGFINGEWGIRVSPWYANLAGIFFALVGAAIFGFILSQLKETPEEGTFRRWMRRAFGLATLGSLAALVWCAVALHRNIAGKGEFRLSQTASAATTSRSATEGPPAGRAGGATPAVSTLDTNAIAFAAAMAAPSTTTGASSPSKDAATGPVKPQPKPVPASKPAMAVDNGRAQTSRRQARAPRWQLDPDFVTEYRRVVGEEP